MNIELIEKNAFLVSVWRTNRQKGCFYLEEVGHIVRDPNAQVCRDEYCEYWWGFESFGEAHRLNARDVRDLSETLTKLNEELFERLKSEGIKL